MTVTHTTHADTAMPGPAPTAPQAQTGMVVWTLQISDAGGIDRAFASLHDAKAAAADVLVNHLGNPTIVAEWAEQSSDPERSMLVRYYLAHRYYRGQMHEVNATQTINRVVLSGPTW
ncbi:hypothetical protein [Nocardioides sp. Leaf285]|uniref:hypothetical protein n=1 Tax=Nocardioides sp. Leaf285 TaxID=1736322 RepID=UPI0007031A83|nr:hypothetical protein [Nocardioides sp. Leaf285]KQP63030.1 hypothetical protein ASF47_18640 [Nocardioides sp. Leaf285]